MPDIYLFILIYLVVLIVLLFIRTWIAISLALTGFIGLFILLNNGEMVGLITYNALYGFTLTAVPLFILMGEILLRGGAGEDLYHGLGPLFERILPGGLLHANIVACGLFGAVCGSALAGTATISTVALPQLNKRGYEKSFAVGSLVGAGPLSSIIPPSIVLIIFGSLTQVSVSKLFMAGILPGILLILLMMLAVWIKVKIRPQAVPEKPNLELSSCIKALARVLPIIVLAVVIIYSIQGGIATPTEAGAIGTAVSVLLCLVLYRKLSWSHFIEACRSTVKTTSVILFLIVGAQIFAFSISQSGFTTYLAEAFLSIPGAPGIKLFILLMLYFLLGMFMDIVSVMLITLPISFPLFMALGCDPLWVGVVMTFMGSIGGITPPVGLGLFLLQSISGLDTGTILRGSIPFLVAQIVGLAIICYLPVIVLWLPSFM